jgi:small subunit ribosomal protein S3Ae
MVSKKAKAKEWFSIIAPKKFDNIEIGKTLTSDPKQLIGRKIAVSLMELTNNFSKFYMKFYFKISKIDGNKAYTDFVSSECMRDYISRMVTKRIRRVDTVQNLITKDGAKIRVKSLAIVPRRIKSSIQKVIRAKINEVVQKQVESTTLDDIIEDVMNDQTKKQVLRETRRAYPIRNFEIRKIEVSSQAKTE